MAVELAASNVLVNSLSPGFVLTEMTASTLSAEEQEALAAQVPAGRFAQPEEIARVALFLTSEANTYLTGQNIVVDGGFVGV
jgi:3-oxoacyl-[acyl-carrier protein] reductase